MNDLDLEEVRAWARAGGQIARQKFNHVTARRKADRTLVTEADEQIERTLVERIAARYPEHGILGEESTRRTTNHEYVWAIDPLDGTNAFVAGLPFWAVSIGLLRQGRPYAGVIHLPLMDDDYWVAPGGPAYLNSNPLSVRGGHPIESEDWMAVPSNIHRRFSIDFIGKVRSLGSTALGFCYVARGSAAGALIAYSSLWDIAAGMAILDAAGGAMVGLSGQRLDPATLLDGTQMIEPQIVAPATLADSLRQGVKRLPTR